MNKKQSYCEKHKVRVTRRPKTKEALLATIAQFDPANGKGTNNIVCEVLRTGEAAHLCGRALSIFVSQETGGSLPSSLLLPPL